MARKQIALKAKDVLKRLLARSKTKPPTETTTQEAKLVAGAGDKSDPMVGRYRAGQKSGRGGTTIATQAMSTKAKDKLARQRSAKESLEWSKTLKKGSLAQLKDEYHHLNKGDQRAERLKGSESKFYEVFKSEGMKPVSPKAKVKPKTKAKSTSKKARKVLGLKKKSTVEERLKDRGYDLDELDADNPYKKKGGRITYRMTGGQVVSHGYD
tara:strand:- start:7 stop:639 length:633 start_codon:yes stop_codon:yes gene_type:complete